jgi:beta-glucosidase
VDDRIEKLLTELTVEEKARVVSGADMWRTPPVERLGIPQLKVSDGPVGARGGTLGGEVAAASFPCGIALGATWNTELIGEVGKALGQECRTKGAQVLLGPTVNLHRHPLGGRHFECYSEDPLLSAEIGVAWIRGLQGEGVGACVKHYVANDSEFERHTISSEVADRPLRELYLLPFEHAVKRAGTWSLMGSYNRVNGTYACEHEGLLKGVLKGEWGWDGAVISDWFAVQDGPASARNGCDLEMPGPARHWGKGGEKLAAAVRAGDVPEAALDEAVRRMLRLSLRTGAFANANQPEAPERAEDRPEHRAIARRAAVESIVLVKNERDALPLAGGPGKAIRRLAVIGPNARHTSFQGGGSARVSPHYEVSVLAGLEERAKAAGVEIVFAPGCARHKRIPGPVAAWLAPARGEGNGLTVEFWNGLEPAGAAGAERRARNLDFSWFGGAFAPGIDPREFCARLTGRFTPPESGVWTLSLTVAGRARLLLDGKVVVDAWDGWVKGDSFYNMGSAEIRAEVPLEAGRSYDVQVDYARIEARFMAGLRVGMMPPVPADAESRAVEIARGCDAAVVVVGTDADWETEGVDRKLFHLPGPQDALIDAVAAANPRTIVALNVGSPHAMPWLDEVAAVLYTWFGGQEAGHALADVVFGDADPGGRLPTTVPRRLEDTPAYLNYPGEHGKVYYGEGVFGGHRSYDARGVEPLFPFGFGLSYTRFELGEPTVRVEEGAGESGDVRVHVALDVTNAGARAGQEVVQLYVADVESSVARPPTELRAFAKVSLAAGERKRVEWTLGAEAFAFWNPVARTWTAEAGEYELRIGRHSRDLAVRARLSLAHDHESGPDRALGG